MQTLSENGRRSLWLAGIGLCCAAIAGCAARSSDLELLHHPVERDYVVGPGDILEITVWKNETVSRTVPVRPDGRISLPLINDVLATGRTPLQLRQEIAAKLAQYIPDPEVSVIVREVRSAAVSVFGEVARPGRFVVNGETTLVQILADAGGLTEFASRRRIVVLRPSQEGLRRIVVSHDDMLGRSTKKSIYLQPGDIVVVP